MRLKILAPNCATDFVVKKRATDRVYVCPWHDSILAWPGCNLGGGDWTLRNSFSVALDGCCPLRPLITSDPWGLLHPSRVCAGQHWLTPPHQGFSVYLDTSSLFPGEQLSQFVQN